MIKNSTLKAFIVTTLLVGATATITAGICTNWFRATETSSSYISEESSVTDSSTSLESSAIEESTSRVEESITSDSSASSSLSVIEEESTSTI